MSRSVLARTCLLMIGRTNSFCFTLAERHRWRFLKSWHRTPFKSAQRLFELASTEISATQGSFHGMLYLDKHLLTVREQITPFEI